MASMWNRSFYLLCLLVMRISSLDGNEICLTSASRPYLGTDNLTTDPRLAYRWLNAGLFIEGVAGIAPTCRWSSR